MDYEVYIVSYPKSGRTWLKLLIGKYLVLKYKFDTNVLSTEQLIADSELKNTCFIHDGSSWQPENEKFGLPSNVRYDELDDNKQRYKNSDVIFLEREVKDVLVSSYCHTRYRDGKFHGDIQKFIYDPVFGAKKICRFNQIWKQNKNIPRNFLPLRYEDMHTNTKRTLINVLTFLGDDIDEDKVNQSVDFCVFDKLNKAELSNEINLSSSLSAIKSNPESMKIRKGKIGGYVEYMTQDQIDVIDKIKKEYE
jgi:hypothetical protein